MKIIAFNGSPRSGGNTELLLKETIKGIVDTGLSVHTFNLNEMNIRPCQDCGGCNETGKCIVNDDMDQIYEAIRSADRIILASPIFFFSISAQSKIMIDRCQSFWCEKYLLKEPIKAGIYGRKGLLLLVGGMKKEIGIQCAETCAQAFFRTISVAEHEKLFFLGIDAKGEILHHPTALKDAYEAGRKLVELKVK
ncbi:MAG: flavodoxin family protein [Nitrospirae bacterium]|nr:flavodoxin family protein [Nitrospirota bacterium]